MKKSIVLLSLLFSISFPQHSKADEGMWLPHLISGNFSALEKLGCKLTAEDIYSVNKSSCGG
jgi:hypothetical protein